MFGYIKPYIPELKVREHELYRAFYCGLCRAMGKITGQLSRFTLSYDFVFLAAVRILLTGETAKIMRNRCVAHPLSPRNSLSECSALRYTSAVAAALFAGKNDDDLSDEKGLRRFRARLVRPAASHMIRKSGIFTDKPPRFPEKEAAVDGCSKVAPLLSELASLEKEGCDSMDRCASVFGELTAALFSSGLDPAPARVAREIGRGVGRFIYIADACDDAAEDLRLGRYNPILSAYGDRAVEDGALSEDIGKSVRTAALLDLERTAAAADLACDGICGNTGNVAPDKDVAAIVKNIIYIGMPRAVEDVTNRRE